MAGFDEAIAALREAVNVSPQNVPLRMHLAETCLNAGKADEAEKEYRAALSLDPQHAGVKLGLATAFYRQGKSSPAIVIVEELLKAADVPPKVYVLHARLLLKEGDVERAVRQYKRGLLKSPPT